MHQEISEGLIARYEGVNNLFLVLVARICYTEARTVTTF